MEFSRITQWGTAKLFGQFAHIRDFDTFFTISLEQQSALWMELDLFLMLTCYQGKTKKIGFMLTRTLALPKEKLAGIQAVVVGAGTEHTRVIPGSHLKDFSHLIPEGAPASHWFKPDPKDGIFRKEDSIVIHAKPGDVILFMEGLVHSGTQPTKGERIVYYVTGVTNLTEKMRINYEKWVKDFRTTGHSLYKANAENPQHYGDPDLMPENHFCFCREVPTVH
jgi:hypothetical protein